MAVISYGGHRPVALISARKYFSKNNKNLTANNNKYVDKMIMHCSRGSTGGYQLFTLPGQQRPPVPTTSTSQA